MNQNPTFNVEITIKGLPFTVTTNQFATLADAVTFFIQAETQSFHTVLVRDSEGNVL